MRSATAGISARSSASRAATLGGERVLVMEPGCSLCKSRPDRLGASHTGCLELTEGADRLVVESN
jgi:hypothetical protein